MKRKLYKAAVKLEGRGKDGANVAYPVDVYAFSLREALDKIARHIGDVEVLGLSIYVESSLTASLVRKQYTRVL